MKGKYKTIRGRLNEEETDQTPAKAAGEQKRNMKAREPQVLRNVGMVPPAPTPAPCCRRNLPKSPHMLSSCRSLPRVVSTERRFVSSVTQPNANFKKRVVRVASGTHLVDLRD